MKNGVDESSDRMESIHISSSGSYLGGSQLSSSCSIEVARAYLKNKVDIQVQVEGAYLERGIYLRTHSKGKSVSHNLRNMKT
ncbi:hypothetical protein KY290_014551 [Solanum tuberosum]|uniref:Uncharacterized protein n=1 Tax=Solanum tuberosum TaxID=4113 RepID=A0ABQ7VQL8_SOLTU|nr:hypothetical protein KY290_014551 [Solanum tuberosum]